MTSASPGSNTVSAISPMGYDDARALIQDGDLIAVRGNGGGLPALIRWVTRSPYSHTGIALWMDSRLLMVETRGVAALVPLSQYADNDFDVIRYPVPAPQSKTPIADAIFDVLGITIKYDFVDLLRIALHEWFGFKLPAREDGNMVCSSLTATIYCVAGWNPPSLASIPSPRDVVAAAGPVALQVRADYTRG